MVSTLAGGVNGINGAYADASGTNAGFSRPYGLAVDANGNIFVADSDNQRIRKVTAGGGTRIVPVTLCARCAGIDAEPPSGVRALSMMLPCVAFRHLFVCMCLSDSVSCFPCCSMNTFARCSKVLSLLGGIVGGFGFVMQ